MSEMSLEHHDDVDVPAALERVTDDGFGTDVLPESDFVAYATDGVEKEDDE